MAYLVGVLASHNIYWHEDFQEALEKTVQALSKGDILKVVE